MEIVATTSLPAVDRPNADRWNAASSWLLRYQAKTQSHFFGTPCFFIYMFGDNMTLREYKIEEACLITFQFG